MSRPIELDKEIARVEALLAAARDGEIKEAIIYLLTERLEELGDLERSLQD